MILVTRMLSCLVDSYLVYSDHTRDSERASSGLPDVSDESNSDESDLDSEDSSEEDSSRGGDPDRTSAFEETDPEPDSEHSMHDEPPEEEEEEEKPQYGQGPLSTVSMVDIDPELDISGLCKGYHCNPVFFNVITSPDDDGNSRCILCERKVEELNVNLQFVKSWSKNEVAQEMIGQPDVKRHCVYRYFAMSVFQWTERLPLPRCVVMKVRQLFPNEEGVDYAQGDDQIFF